MSTGGAGSTKSPEAALGEIVKALSGVEEGERGRVLASVAAFFGTKVDLGQEWAGEVGAEDRLGPPPAGGGTLAGLMEKAKPVTTPQKLATFAYFRKRHEGKAKFSRAELLTYFEKAEEAEPGNYARDFRQACDEGWIHDKGDQSYLTKKGSDAVVAGFGGKAKPRGATKKARAKK